MAIQARTVLIVDDEELIRWHLADTLEDAGFTTIGAASAAEAIKILESDRRIEIVFTDIQMPGSMDGLALANYIRERWPPTILVIASGKVPPDRKGVPVGSSLLSKPYGRSEISAVISDIEAQLSK